MLAGLAGAIKAHSQRGVGTEFGYGLNESIIFLGMLGGMLAGVFPELSGQLLTSFRPIFFGAALMLFLIYEPRGLAHRWQLLSAGWRLRPFAR